MAKKTPPPQKIYTEEEKIRAKAGRKIALWIAGVGIYWIAATYIGGMLDLSQRYRALLDLIALAGFGWVLWEVFKFWRSGQSGDGR